MSKLQNIAEEGIEISHDTCMVNKKKMRLRDSVKKRIPAPWTRMLKGIIGLPSFVFDYWTFFTYQGGPQAGSYDADRAYLILNYHILEKALSFKNTRTNFGVEVHERLLNFLDFYIHKWGHDRTVLMAESVLEAYCAFHEAHGGVCTEIRAHLKKISAQSSTMLSKEVGGIIDITRNEIQSSAKGNFQSLVYSRHSIRHFEAGSIDPVLIQKAIAIAAQSPSACNRQAWHVHSFAQNETMQKILEIQGGARGFGDQASLLLVVSSDNRCFFGAQERHQPWIDGSLFAMSLLYALHSLGLGACPLHCCFKPKQEKMFRQMTKIPVHEPLIMLITVGRLPAHCKVAASARLFVDEILVSDSLE